MMSVSLESVMMDLKSWIFWAAGGAWSPWSVVRSGCGCMLPTQHHCWDCRCLSLCKSPRKLAIVGGGKVNLAAFEANHDDYNKEYQKLHEKELSPCLTQPERCRHIHAWTCLWKTGRGIHIQKAHTHKDQCWWFPGSCGHPWGGHPKKSAEYSGFPLILLGHSILRWELALSALLSIAMNYDNVFRLAQVTWETMSRFRRWHNSSEGQGCPPVAARAVPRPALAGKPW